MTEIENRITILSDILSLSKYRRDFYADFLDDWGMGLYISKLIVSKVILEMTPLMKVGIDGAFDKLLELHGLEDTGFDEFWEIDGNLPTREQYYSDKGAG